MKILDNGYVRLILKYGSDQDVIEDARMSTDKGFLGWENDLRLLNFLYANRHMTPFEGSGMKIEIKAPIMVFREWHRHRTQSYNEMSGRYTEIPDEHYVPSVERIIDAAIQAAASKNKQQTATHAPEIINVAWAEAVRSQIIYVQKRQQESYQDLLKSGVPKELARINMPLSRYSKMRATANLRNWIAFLTLREDASAQWEIRQYARAVAGLIGEHFPKTWGLYVESK